MSPTTHSDFTSNPITKRKKPNPDPQIVMVDVVTTQTRVGAIVGLSRQKRRGQQRQESTSDQMHLPRACCEPMRLSASCGGGEVSAAQVNRLPRLAEFIGAFIHVVWTKTTKTHDQQLPMACAKIIRVPLWHMWLLKRAGRTSALPCPSRQWQFGPKVGSAVKAIKNALIPFQSMRTWPWGGTQVWVHDVSFCLLFCCYGHCFSVHEFKLLYCGYDLIGCAPDGREITVPYCEDLHTRLTHS